jgi:hypothetical protein
MNIKEMYDMIGGNCPMFFDWIFFYGKVKGAKAYDHVSKVCNNITLGKLGDFMMSDELEYLKSCPFCGRRDELVITHVYDGEDYIQCSRCRTGDVHKLVWNHRAESNPFSEMVWLEEELKEKK